MIHHPRRILFGFAFATLTLGAGSTASASFHLMQIEQAIGGVCGDSSQQAIQLRMRFGGQNLVSGHSLALYDANGESRTLLLTFPSDAANGAAGARILVATAQFAAARGITPDFVLPQQIPDSRLRSARLTFEDSPSSVLWALAWGGNRYLGTNVGLTTNDPDGNFGPAATPALPASSARALQFGGAASASSTTNLADYALSTGAATFTNNAGAAVTLPGCVFADTFVLGDLFEWSSFLGGELCNGIDDDGDLAIDEDFPLGQSCLLPGSVAGTFVCAPDGRGVICN